MDAPPAPPGYNKLGILASVAEGASTQHNVEATSLSNPLNKQRRNPVAWDTAFQSLMGFKEMHGHANVSSRDNHFLGQWLAKQRLHYRLNCLEQKKIDLLNELGISWQVRPPRGGSAEELWQRKYEVLRTYSALYGSTWVPNTWKTNQTLAE